jgi:Flp pilus assembly protein TadD
MSNPTRRLGLLVLACVVGAAGVGMVIAFLRGHHILESVEPTPPSDPRLEYAGPYENVNPAVRYVPDSRCSECHAPHSSSYAVHPMAHSLRPIAEAAPREPPPPKSPFEAFGSRFQVDHQGEKVYHRRTRLDSMGRTVAEQSWEVHYVIGSGSRGFSYLTDLEGYLFQTPISWYSLRKGWDLSPGFGPTLQSGRAVLHDCLFCHSNHAHSEESSVNHYREPVFDGYGIGCQRCHGPGERHVAAPGAGKGPQGIDPTIVNPKHLPPDLRDAICEQCHLQGASRTKVRGRDLYDFRPAMPMEAFWSVFVRVAESGEDRKAIGQVEQMAQSRCFQGSQGPGRLGCISCHDPHNYPPPAGRVAYYRDRCLKCHDRRPCSLPEAVRHEKSPDDSCIACHMPRYGAADMPHTAATNHRIPRGGKPGSTKEAPPTPADPLLLASYYRGRKGVVEREDDRGRAMALVKLAFGGDPLAARTVPHALLVLEAGLRDHPLDLPAEEALGYALLMQGRSAEALAAFEAILASAPDRELALVGAATTAETLGQSEAALRYWRQVVAANPWAPGYRSGLVTLLAKKEAWAEALPEVDAWLRLDPMSTEARTARVRALLALSNKEAARAEFARLEALAPSNLRELQIRYEKKLR